MDFQKFVTERLADLTEKYNALITNAKRIFELPVQNNLDPSSLIHVSRGDGSENISESLSIQKIIDAVSSGSYDQLLAIGEIDLVDNLVTIPANAQWKISEVYYSNIAEIEITIPYCATGLERKDILVANTLNDIVLVQGFETASGITIRPNIPINTVFVTEIDVTDSTVGEPSTPITGDSYVEKQEAVDAIIDYGATTVIEQINLVDNKSSISLTGLVTDIKSVQQSGEFLRPGKPHFVKNRTGHDVTIWHLAGTGNVKYYFPNELDLVVKPNEVIEFNLNGNDSSDYRFEHVNSNLVVHEKTGAVISLNNVIGNYYNMYSANTATTYTTDNLVLGGKAIVLIYASTKPIVTGATETINDTFVADEKMYMTVWNNGNRIEYFFTTINHETIIDLTALPYGATIAESLTPSTDYFGDPCILKSSMGGYFMSHSVFGSGSDNKKTFIYYNDNAVAEDWTLIKTFTNFIWGTLFEYDSDIYILGVSDYPTGGSVYISKSTDNGLNWSTQVEVLSIPVGYVGWTAHVSNPIIKDGYLANAMSLRTSPSSFSSDTKAVIIFADLTDLTDPLNWSYSNIVSFDGTAFTASGIYSNTSFTKYPPVGGQIVSKGILEGNLVVRSDDSIILLSRLEQTPSSNNAVYLEVTWNNLDPPSSTLGSTHNFINMYGGNVKFQVLWDATSNKHWTVTNLNRYKYFADNRIEAFLISSDDDCETWVSHGKVLGWNPTINWQDEIVQLATQYSHFIIDGDDLFIATRTANLDADSWHNANLLTLTKVADFRSRAEDVYIEGSLIIDENSTRIEDSNGIAIIHDQSKHCNSPFLLNSENAKKPNWVSGGIQFDGASYLRVAHSRYLNLDNGFSVFCVIENLQSTTGLRILAKASGGASDVGANNYSFSVNGLSVGACYTAFTDVATSNNYILAASYDNINNQIWNYKNGANRGTPSSTTGGTWSTDHVNKSVAYTTGNFSELWIGNRDSGSDIYFTSKIKALHIIPVFKNSTDMIAYMNALNAIYGIY